MLSNMLCFMSLARRNTGALSKRCHACPSRPASILLKHLAGLAFSFSAEILSSADVVEVRTGHSFFSEPESGPLKISARALALVPRASSQALPPGARSSNPGTQGLSPISQPTLADLFAAVRSLETCARTRTVNQRNMALRVGDVEVQMAGLQRRVSTLDARARVAELQSAVRTQGNALADLQEILRQARGDRVQSIARYARLYTFF